MFGLITNLAGMLNQLSLNTLTINLRPLSGSSYMELPVELTSPKKGSINIRNKDQKCFLWCHVRQYGFSARKRFYLAKLK